MQIAICIASLALLILLAYRGFSVILIAPLAAMAAVLLTHPPAVAPVYSGLFMDKLGSFVKLYLPVLLLGATFGKLIEVSGAASAIVRRVTVSLGPRHAMLAIVTVGMLLTYGGVSVFVVVFATYPFAAEMFRTADIPKRLIPATIALSAFTITMDALPGTPQIQNIIPTTFFGTTAYAGPVLGSVAALTTLLLSLAYLNWRRRLAQTAGEGYGVGHRNEPDRKADEEAGLPFWLAVLPLVIVAIVNRIALTHILADYGDTAYAILDPGAAKPLLISQEVKANAAVWAVEIALLLGIAATVLLGWRQVRGRFANATQAAVAGSLLATINTASEYGFGAVMAALPGFRQIAGYLSGIHDPLLNAAITTNVLCGLTGSASGGLSLTLGAFSDRFITMAEQNNISLEVMHRIASLASGGMDTLPHNGAIVTLLAVTGMTHREAYPDIFAITLIKTLSVFVAIGVFYATGLV